MEDITDVNYTQAERVCKEFEIKNLGEYHDLYVQSDTLSLTDVFENFRNMCLKIYELDPAKFLQLLDQLQETQNKVGFLSPVEC